MAHEVLKASALIYLSNYHDQLYEKMKGASLVNSGPEISAESFRDFDRAGLVKRLYGLTGEFFRAREGQDAQAESLVRAQFMQLAQGAPFAGQIANILDVLSKEDVRQREYMELQIRLAGCIHGENYREAAIIKKQLEELAQ